MTTKQRRLVRRISELVEADDRLRRVLLDYKNANLKLAKLIESGVPVLEAFMMLDAPIRRRSVTESLKELQAARHQVRLALFALGLEEGSSMSEIGRALGMTRQQASRLAGEAERPGA